MINDHIYVVGITGKARAGKDTLAELLQNRLMHSGVGWNEVYVAPLAYPLKEMAYELVAPFVTDPEDYLWGNSKEDIIEGLGTSARVILQTLGTDWGRKVLGEDIWVAHLVARAKVLFEDAEDRLCILLVPDVRFDNERNVCDMLIRVTRPGVQEVAEHVSEGGVDDDLVDAVIHNGGTEAALEQKARALASHILFNAEEKYHGAAGRLGHTA